MIGDVTAALTLAPLASGAVLLISGVAKLRDPSGAREAFTAMQVPRWLRRPPVISALPWVELALGAGLLLAWSWVLVLVAAATTAMFATYWLLVARVLRSGEAVDCHCFGSLGESRVSARTLARNSVLLGLALVALVVGLRGTGVPPELGDFSGSDWAWLVMSLVVALTGVLVFAGSSSGVPDQIREEDLLDYERRPIPYAILENEAGRRSKLVDLARGRAHLLIFLSTACASCDDVADALPGWVEQLAPVSLGTVFTVPLEHVPTRMRPAGVTAWYDVDSSASDTFAMAGRPAAVLLGADGLMAGGPVAGSAGVLQFVRDIVAELRDADVPAAATPTHGPDDGHGHDHGPDDGHGHDHGPDDGHGHGHGDVDAHA